MKFLYSEWEAFCEGLDKMGLHSVTTDDIYTGQTLGERNIISLKHDVESSPEKALKIAQIEAKYHHKATYFVQSYLMTKENNQIFTDIKALGHLVSLHHDVMDGSQGDIPKAIEIYQKDLDKFEILGYTFQTVCQHGNPMTNFSNRDFFRDEVVQKTFPAMADIMVDFSRKSGQEYVYISDAGMGFKIIFDPLFNDIIPSDDKNMPLGNLDNVLNNIKESAQGTCYIVSSHTHRYNSSALKASIRIGFFKVIRVVGKTLYKVPFLKNILSHFYFIQKKL